jgi:hypothetical protein
LAALTGDPRFRRAAGVLRGKRMGRRAVNDAEALQLVRAFLTAGAARSRSAAICRAAALIAAPGSVDAAARRLARKFRAEKTSGTRYTKAK